MKEIIILAIIKIIERKNELIVSRLFSYIFKHILCGGR